MAMDTAILVPSAPTPARGVIQLFGDARTQRRSRRRARRERREDRRDQRRRERWEHQETLATIRNPPRQSDFPESNLATIADLFAGLFGGGAVSGGGPQPATGGEAVYIPGPESESDGGGGINPAIIIIVLVAGAGAWYWFVYRKKHKGGE